MRNATGSRTVEESKPERAGGGGGEEKERTKRVSRTSEPRESSCGTDGHFRTIVEKSRDYPVFGGVAVARPQSFAHPPRLRSATGTWNAEYYASATLTLRLVEPSPKLQVARQIPKIDDLRVTRDILDRSFFILF